MPKWSNINAKMARNARYSQSISGRSILKPGIGTLSGAPGFAVIAAMETAVHIQEDSVLDKENDHRQKETNLQK
jgi:urocanate hydratase